MPGTIVFAPTMSQDVVDEPTIVGSKIAATGTGGFAIGSTGTHPNATSVAFRFRAERTADVSAAIVVTKGGTGFAAGRGCLEARFLMDTAASHLPIDSERLSVTVSGSAVRYNGTITHVGAVSDRFETSGITTSAAVKFTWSSGKPTLTKNGIYHFEIRNVAANPNGNYDGVTTLSWSREQTVINTEQQIGVADPDLGVSFRNSTGIWSARTSDTPILGIIYDGVNHQGQGYRQPQALTQAMGAIAGPLQKVRQKFLPSANWRINAIGLRVGRWSGSLPLTYRLKNEHTNTTILSAAADYAHWNTITNQAASYPEHRWYARTFVSSFSLTAGVTAALELEVTAGAEYRAYTLNPSNAIGVSSQFWQGQAESTNDGGTTWTRLGGGTIDNDLQMFLRLGSAAPAPICVADTLSSAVYAAPISARRVIEDETLFANDVNPSGTSASSNFPSGINPLVLTAVGSATDCDVALSGNTVNVSAMASSASFTYIAKDIFNQRSSARVSLVTRSDPIVNPAKKEIWIFSPVDPALSTAIMLRYNARLALSPYWHSSFDGGVGDNLAGYEDGRFESNDIARTDSFINSIPTNSTQVCGLDWEFCPNNNYGLPNNTMYLATGGQQAPGSTLNTALAEANQVINYFRSKRPGLRLGFYYCSSLTLAQLYQWAVNGVTGSNWSSIPSRILPLVQNSDQIHPGAYTRAIKSTTTNHAYDTLTSANATTWQRACARNGLQCAEANNWQTKVIPYCSWIYYIYQDSTGNNLKPVPDAWGYAWHKALADETWNGHSIDGLYIWGRKADAALTETKLKITYQALNGLPFDPNMARP